MYFSTLGINRLLKFCQAEPVSEQDVWDFARQFEEMPNLEIKLSLDKLQESMYRLLEDFLDDNDIRTDVQLSSLFEFQYQANGRASYFSIKFGGDSYDIELDGSTKSLKEALNKSKEYLALYFDFEVCNG